VFARRGHGSIEPPRSITRAPPGPRRGETSDPPRASASPRGRSRGGLRAVPRGVDRRRKSLAGCPARTSWRRRRWRRHVSRVK
jgi:hypothetical protein